MSISRPVWNTLRKLLLSGEASSSISVLIFHRVLRAKDPLLPGEPDAAEFEQIIRFVSRNFEVKPLYEALRSQRSDGRVGHSVAITFDDGYADNLTVALPILRKYSAPATFFIASGYLDGGVMFNDRVIESVREHAEPTLDARPLGLGEHDTSDIEARMHAIDALLGAVKHRPPEERETLASGVSEICGVRSVQSRMLTSGQLRELAADDLSEIGGHTVTHPILARIPGDAARREIVEGKTQLEEITGESLRCFAYPNGVPDVDYRPEHVEMVADAGFETAVSTRSGAVLDESDRYQLPRFTPWDRRMWLFGLRLLHVARSEASAEGQAERG